MLCLEFNVNHSQLSLSLFMHVKLFQFYPSNDFNLFHTHIHIYALHPQSCHCTNSRRSITRSPWTCKAIGRKLLAFRRDRSPRDIKSITSIAKTLSGLTGKFIERSLKDDYGSNFKFIFGSPWLTLRWSKVGSPWRAFRRSMAIEIDRSPHIDKSASNIIMNVSAYIA